MKLFSRSVFIALAFLVLVAFASIYFKFNKGIVVGAAIRLFS